MKIFLVLCLLCVGAWSQKLERLPISVVVTAYEGVYTLRKTLDSYVANGLFEMVDEVILLYSQISTVDERALASLSKYPFSHIVGTYANVHVHGTFDVASRLAHNELVLVLQQDFELTADYACTHRALWTAAFTLQRGVAHMVSLRSRANPGIPHWAHHYHGNNVDEMLSYHDGTDQACQVPFWLNDHEIHQFVNKFGLDMRYDALSNFWIASAEICYFNEQASMFVRSWFRHTFAKTLRSLRENPANTTYHNHHSLEIATRYTKDGPWRNRQHYVALGSPGVFTHNDYSKFPHTGIARSHIPPIHERASMFFLSWL